MIRWNDMSGQEQKVWSAAFALAHALELGDHHGNIRGNRIDRRQNELCESVANDCILDLRALNATSERYT